MDAEIPFPMCANPYQYQICIPELKGKCQEEKKEKLMVRIGETNPINQTQLFFANKGSEWRFFSRGPTSFQSSWQIESLCF